MPKKLYHFSHSSPEITTLADLLADQNSPAFLYNTDPERFLKVIGEDKLTNRQRIEATYTLPDDPPKDTKFSRLTIKVGTLLYLEAELVNKPTFLTAGIPVVSNDEPAFKAAKLAEIEADPGYFQINRPIHGQLLTGISQQQYPDVSVWIWCAALSPRTNESAELKGQIINLSPFIERIETNMSKNGGNFRMKLPPLVCELDEHNKWVLKKSAITQYNNKQFTSLQGDGYVAHSSLFHSETYQQNPNKASDDVLVREQMWFHNVIGQNDLVFIRFETLDMEKEQRYEDAQEFFVDKANLANRIYDMIGLVDTNAQSVNPANNDVSITISGRDLSKLFIDDGTYFYALENSQGLLRFAGQSTIKDPQLNRIFADGGMSFIGLYLFQSIETILKFIISQLSNIKIVPDDLFTSYTKSIKKVNGVTTEYDSRSKVFRMAGVNGVDLKKRKVLKGQAMEKLTQLKSAAGKPSTNTEEIFSKMVDFLDTIRKENKRQVGKMSGDTIWWKSFTYKGEKIDEGTLPQYINYELLNDKGEVTPTFIEFLNLCDSYIDAGNSKKHYEEQLAAGVWQLIDLVIDETVASRRLADSSMSTASGSLLNFIRSACQEPLVEFFMDTYGDRYNLIVRRPPYDQKGLITLIEGKVNTQTGVPQTPPAIVDVEQEDVLLENLVFETTSYSWYHFFPRNNMLGSSNEYSLSYLGALYFPEYAEAFGTHPFQQSNTYIPFHHLKNKNEGGLGIDELQAIEDLKYVAESNQYLPFSRRGTLTLNRDRRLKIGNLFRYKSTGEVGIITGVQHAFSISEHSIDAVTTIEVERLLIEQFIYGKYLADENGHPQFVSYFNIIDTRLSFTKKLFDVQETTRVKKKSVLSTQTITDSTKPVIQQTSYYANNFLYNSVIIESLGGNVGLGFLKSYNQYPEYKNTFIAFINLVNKAGYWVHITDGGDRSLDDQIKFYRLNRKNAVPGTSKHGKGSAMDINLIDKRTGDRYLKHTSTEKWLATGVVDIAKSVGLKWGGEFPGYKDNVHFEIVNKREQLTNAQREADEWEYKTETVKKMQTDREGIFKNFKTNSFVFHFFRKKLQFSPEHRNVTSREIYNNSGLLLNEVTVRSKGKRN